MSFEYKNDILHCDNIALPDIAEEFGTPTYVYSANVIRSQYNALIEAVKNHIPAKQQPMICYACKANSNIAILKLLGTLGSGLEIVSEGELYRGLKAGFKGQQMISTSFGKTESEIRAYLEADLHQINVEAIPELQMVNQIAGEMDKVAKVVFRLNPNISGGGHDKISTGRSRDKFGHSADRIMEIYKLADEMEHVTPVGIAVHIGSQVFNVEQFKPAFEKVAETVKALRSEGLEVTRLDIGGGFPIQYNNEDLLDLDAYAQWVRDIIVPLDTEIQMEPGRYLTGNSGILLTRVAYIKETQDQDFIALDAGMNDLLRPAMYDAYHNFIPVETHKGETRKYDIAGPICESSDIFARGRELPTVNQDDLIAIETAGAYGFSMASNYNSRTLPAEILIDGDKLSTIRERQTLDEMIAGETIPDWL